MPAFAGAWLLPAFLLLAGLALEAWYLRGTQRRRCACMSTSRLKLGRPARGAFAFAHNRGRELVLQYARVLPPALRQTDRGAARSTLPPEEELLDPVDAAAAAPRRRPLRGRAGAVVRPVRARVVDARRCRRMRRSPWRPTACRAARGRSPANPRARRRAACRAPAWSCCSCATTCSGDALSRIDWKATARRGALISREYSEAQHLEILLVIDAGRAQPRARRRARPPRPVRQRGGAARRARGLDRRPRRACWSTRIAR